MSALTEIPPFYAAMRYTLSIGFITCLLLQVLFCGCRAGGCRAPADSDSVRDILMAEIGDANDLTCAGWRYADSVLNTLTDEEKAGMLYMPAVFARSDRAAMGRLMQYAVDMHVGGIVLLKGSLESAAAIADTLRRLGGPGFFIAVDAENGLRMRFPDAPEFPWSRELGRLDDDQIMYDFGREIARECREAGINMVLGPVMDVVPGEITRGLMRRRSLGSDPKRVADLAVAYARGVEDGNVISVAKHFPGHGSSDADSHKRMGLILRSKPALDSIDLYPFRRYAAEGLSGVMVGHLSVRSLDSVMRPAVASPVIMNDILRGELGFKGLVMTDALNMEGAMGVKGYEAMLAGADIIIAPADTRREIEATIDAIRGGKLPRSTVDDRCRRILFFKYLLGVDSEAKVSACGIRERVESGATGVRDSLTSALHRSRNSSLPGK